MAKENRRINPETGKPYPTQKETLDEITASIEQGIKDVFNSDNYRNYLSVMSRFHNYSTNNCMLIYMQNPNATRVASEQEVNSVKTGRMSDTEQMRLKDDVMREYEKDDRYDDYDHDRKR